jgi:hypothetical protein
MGMQTQSMFSGVPVVRSALVSFVAFSELVVGDFVPHTVM